MHAHPPPPSGGFNLELRSSDLECLDYVMWLGNGNTIANILKCDQSNVSKKKQNCLDYFGLYANKTSNFWTLFGDTKLLSYARSAAQQYRLSTGSIRISLPNNFRGITDKILPSNYMGIVDHIISPFEKLILLDAHIIDGVMLNDGDELEASQLEKYDCTMLSEVKIDIIGADYSISNLNKPLKILTAESWKDTPRNMQIIKSRCQPLQIKGHRYTYKNYEALVNAKLSCAIGDKFLQKINPSWNIINQEILMQGKYIFVTRKNLDYDFSDLVSLMDQELNRGGSTKSIQTK